MLYQSLKDQLIKHILDGTFSNGDTLPSEYELITQYNLSRVTVRKALQELKVAKVISSVERIGSVVTYRQGGYPGNMDIISLMVGANNPFFTSFIEHFEKIADESESLIILKQDFVGKAFQSDEMFYKFVKKDIRNFVLWPHTMNIDMKLLQRLRSIGANLVFFDQPIKTDFADVVCVDNEHAINSLVTEVYNHYAGRLIYVGYSGANVPSVQLREKIFMQLGHTSNDVYHIQWQVNLEKEAERLVDELVQKSVLPAAILCCNGTLGLELAKCLRRRGIKDVLLAAIDYLPEMEYYDMLAYEQPVHQMAECVYRLMASQNYESATWKPQIHRFQGRILHLGNPYGEETS